ncbi:MAG: hypothetical protein ACXWTY_08200 [Methylobacter sp.]|jgi:hypothetical protein
MTIDQLHQYLQSDLRFVLENPTDESKVGLVSTIKAYLNEAALKSEHTSLWWMNQIISIVRSFSRFPTKEEYHRVNRMTRQYHELVTSGIIEPVGVTRKKQFDTLTDWFSQELEDRASAVINNPTDNSMRTLKEQLKRFCERSRVSLD